MTNKQALDIVIAAACNWGENAEEAFRFRIEDDMDDAKVREAVDFNQDGNPSNEDVADAMQMRELWRAVQCLQS